MAATVDWNTLLEEAEWSQSDCANSETESDDASTSSESDEWETATKKRAGRTERRKQKLMERKQIRSDVQDCTETRWCYEAVIDRGQEYAYQIQRAHGDVSKAARRMLSHSAQSIEKNGFSLCAKMPILSEGDTLPELPEDTDVELLPFRNQKGTFRLLYILLR